MKLNNLLAPAVIMPVDPTGDDVLLTVIELPVPADMFREYIGLTSPVDTTETFPATV